MIPSTEGPSLRDRVTDALDVESVSARIERLLSLIEDYTDEQTRIAYRQGRNSVITCDHNVIPVRSWWRRRWVCVRMFREVPTR